MPATRLRTSLIGGAFTTLWVLYAAGSRPGLTPDAMSYLGAAQSLVQQGSLREPFAPWDAPDSTSPLTDYPAGFSLVLALPIAAGVPAPRAAVWVEALSAGGAVAAAAAVAGAVAGELAALVVVVLLALMPALVDVSLLVVSEPLFLFFLVLTIAGMVRHPERPLWGGLAAAGANLVRYAGVFLVAGVGIWQAAQPGPWRTRVRRAGLAIAPGALLHLYWRLEGIMPGGGISAGFYSGLGGTLGEGWRTVAAWLAPGLSGLTATLVAVALIAALAVAWWKIRDENRQLLTACGLLGALYLATLGFTRLFVISDLPLDGRMLLPLCFVVALGTGVTLRSRVGLTIVGLWALMAMVRDVREIRHTHAVGVDYEVAEWQESAVASWVRGAGQGRVLFTNDPAGIWFTTGRPSRLLPGNASPDSVKAFQARFDSRPSALVAFDVPFGLDSADPDSVAASLHLVRAATFAHGKVWIRR